MTKSDLVMRRFFYFQSIELLEKSDKIGFDIGKERVNM